MKALNAFMLIYLSEVASDSALLFNLRLFGSFYRSAPHSGSEKSFILKSLNVDYALGYFPIVLKLHFLVKCSGMSRF